MDATEHFNRGLGHYDASRFDEACSEFSQAIELAPSYSAPYTGRGYVFYLNGDLLKAIADFSIAVRLNPCDADAWKGRADSRQLCGEFADAILDYSEAIRLNPIDSDHFHRRGDAYSAIGDIPKAIEDYLQATVLNPSNPISHYFLAWNLARANRFSDAVHHYKEAFRVDSNLDAEVYGFYAWLLATCPESQFRDPPEAIRLAKVACELTAWCEDQPLGILAAAYAANGEYGNAVGWQIKACEFADDDRIELQRTRLVQYQSGRAGVGAEEP